METKWLEDFLTLVKYGNMTKAAEIRFVSQPAFSRRINSLEEWLGAELFDRTKKPIQLTCAGQDFIEKADEMLSLCYKVRDDIQSLKFNTQYINLFTQHSLIMSFIPELLERIKLNLKNTVIKLKAYDQQEAIDEFLKNNTDFLICYTSFGFPKRLHNKDFIESFELGKDRLIMISVANYKHTQHLKLINYPPGSFFNRLVNLNFVALQNLDINIEKIYECELAISAISLVKSGLGVAWVPESLVINELKTGQLKLYDETFPAIDLSIKAFCFSSVMKSHSKFIASLNLKSV